MNPFEMVVLIVMVVMVAGVLKSFIERKKPGGQSGDMMDKFMDDMGLGDYATKSSLAPYLEKIDAMEERIRVLERIATDKKRNLADEINRL
ncbi:hypothetical protein [Paremcibacter congregatus]|jgi:hypothetical protein|uniref:Uncharacterized protein n=1 Tax=Paremcibacter congregatus TaxID=2043170 RepID=A0A2G4YP63_9PROT|nr:hypothetical protein [Paremcibacter congregatus]PHZ84090.1 hypothetical protein CRD36_12880 [Paremcibacter congregatus]QDE25849.1 hypothetical protein FIV45_00435 [Paremcibacter congregatus]|tara:strand:- start:8393 stop:8665 length:273 start_codon:yes stop_codon:yes gene_type:complete